MSAPDKYPMEENRDGANIAAVIYVVMLVIGGIWLLNKLDPSNVVLKCVTSGLTNCHETTGPDASQ
jgi:hypothetical protein